MSRSVAVPYFPLPPQNYDARYLAEVTRAFSVYAQQMNTPGPLRSTELTLTDQSGNVTTGQLSYNASEDTVDLTHLNGVVQQIGLEQFMRCTNDTGATIENGAVVGFSGVGTEIEIAKYQANATANELYMIGVATYEMAAGSTGMVTTYGKVRGIDTTGQGGETWSVGDILYASPTTAGGLTNVRPTAPNVVISVAAVLVVDATAGEIMVRPTVPIGLDYGAFDSDTDQTLSAINTATAVTLTHTLLSNGITLSSGSRLNAAKAGFYQIEANFQLTSGSSSAKNVFFWLRKNGTDISDTTRAITVDINSGYVPISLNYTVSLAASDYVELYWAANDTNVTLDAIAASSFAPSTPSVLININQLQL